MTETSSESGLHVQVAALPDEVPRVRQAVREWLRSAGNRCDWFTAELLVSELVTNALRHGDGRIEARLSVDRAGVALFVSDDGRELPAVRRGDASASGGLGLQIVDRLASRWGVTPRADGKTVWVVLAD